MPSARSAGRVCAEALHRLRLRYPAEFAGKPNRSEGSAQRRLWRGLVKPRSRWYNSRWSPSELALADRHARLLVAHRFPHIRAREPGTACDEHRRAKGEVKRSLAAGLGQEQVDDRGTPVPNLDKAWLTMPGAGVEPARPESGSRDFKSLASANSATPANDAERQILGCRLRKARRGRTDARTRCRDNAQSVVMGQGVSGLEECSGRQKRRGGFGICTRA